MGERVRIQDIADELGLSTATVSNVIHGKTKKVSDETVKRVQELLEKRAYIPSMAGILLAQNNSRIIGIAVNNHPKYEQAVLQDAFIASSLNALSIEIERAGFFMMVKTTEDWNEIIPFASMWNMEGLILIGFCQQDYQRLREKMHIPFVVYDGYFEENSRICNLFIDNYDGGRQMGAYLRRMGHRRVLCLADNNICMDRERIMGCRDGMTGGGADCMTNSGLHKAKDAGCADLRISPKHQQNGYGAFFMQIPYRREDRIAFYEEHYREILKKYTAVFAVSDEYAIEFMHFLQKKDIPVPEAISIAGFDDIPLCEKVFPELTTIGQNWRERAEKALAALKGLKNHENVEPLQILPARLVIRNSVKNLL